jgi:hypothetical protein
MGSAHKAAVASTYIIPLLGRSRRLCVSTVKVRIAILEMELAIPPTRDAREGTLPTS